MSAYDRAKAASWQMFCDEWCLGAVLNFGSDYLHMDDDDLLNLSWFPCLERFDMAMFVWSQIDRRGGEVWNQIKERCRYYDIELSALGIAKALAPFSISQTTS